MSNQDHHLPDPDLISPSKPSDNDAQHHDFISSLVRDKVRQCGALLQQQLERKAKQEPLIYEQSRIDRVMQDFKDASSDLQSAIVDQVMSRLSTHIQQEVFRVLEDAISDGEKVLQAPIFKPRFHHDPPVDVLKGQPPLQDSQPLPHLMPQEQDVSLQAQDDAPPHVQDEIQDEVIEEALHQDEVMEEDEPQSVPEPVAHEPSTPEATIDRVMREFDSAPHDVQAAIADQLLSKLSSQTPLPDDLPTTPSSDPNGQVYEGTVKLRLEANGPPRQVVHFVEALRRNTDFRLLQLVGSYKDGVEVWLGLRVPLHLQDVLMNINGVSNVQVSHNPDHQAQEPLLDISLAQPVSPG